MAITGTFLADFSSFTAAVSSAEVHLKSFETGSSKVETALTRMANSLSGTRLIQDATLMVEAVNRVGGVSKLTDAELARVGRTASEAAEKMRAMGIDVPPGLQKIAEEAKKVDTTHGSLIGTVKSLALGFGALFTVRAAFNFVGDVVKDASALKDLSQQTHITVEELQLLAGAMSEFGIDADTLGKGLFTLSRRIATGDDSVADALLQMGMSLKDVQGLEGEQLFLAIERGLATLQGSLRDTTASELFGSRLGMAMAGASEGIDGAMASARRLNTVMSLEAVEALDRYEEAIQRTKNSLGALVANMIGPVAEGFNVIADAAGRGAGKWDIFVAMTKDWVASNSITGASTANLAKLLDDLNRTTDAGSTTTKSVTAAHRAFVPALESTAGATKKAREEAEAFERALVKEAIALQKVMSEVNNAQGMADFEAAAATRQRALENEEGLLLRNRDAWQLQLAARQAAQQQAEAQALAEAQLSQQVVEGLTIIGQLPGVHQAAGDAAMEATGRAVHGYAMVAQQVEVSGDAIRAWLELMRYSADVSAILATNPLFTSVTQRQRIAGMAAGGPVSSGTPYMVGERGPELFVPRSAGTIVPNRGGRRGATIYVSVDARESFYDTPAGVQRLATRVGEAVMARMRSYGATV